MRSPFLFILLCILPLAATAQQITFKELINLFETVGDYSASRYSRADLNGRTCALIKVQLPVEGCLIEGDVVGDVEFRVTEYWVYVPENTKRLIIRCPGMETSTVVWQPNPGNNGVRSGVTYSLRLSGWQRPNNSIDPTAQTGYIGHTYVDLGLSVKWATCNLGADRPEGDGNYFAWGEVASKQTYTDKNCPTYGKKRMGGKKMESPTTLTDVGLDAAMMQLGTGWRMPTKEEISELRLKCTWTWTEQNGVAGYRVTSKQNGNSIFLPASGFHGFSEPQDKGRAGAYWTSTPVDGQPGDAFYLSFDGIRGDVFTSYGLRYRGLTIRPVVAEPTPTETELFLKSW